MTILVTGATGFIGAHLVSELAQAGHTVTGADLNPPDRYVDAYLGTARERVRFVQADLSMRGELVAAVPGPLDAIVHAAAVTPTAADEARDPERVVRVNLLGTLEILEHARRTRTRRFVYVSSSGVYGETDPGLPVAESHRPQLASLYAMTKYAGEQVVADGAGNGLATASVRIAAPYGPMERPTGTRTAMSVIYTLVRAAVARHTVRLAGWDRTRDWTHAADIAGAVRLLLEGPAPDAACYNVSSGTMAPLAHVAEVLAGIVPGFSWQPAPADRNTIDGTRVQRRGPLDTARIRALGFRPRYTLADGLRETVTWVRRLEAGAVTEPGGGV